MKECEGRVCPVEVTIDLLQPKWTLHIIRELQEGKRRFNELSHNLGGVNPRTLCQRLRELEEQGIVTREIVSSIPPWVEYSLTQKGRALNGVIMSIDAWSREWMDVEASASSRGPAPDLSEMHDSARGRSAQG